MNNLIFMSREYVIDVFKGTKYDTFIKALDSEGSTPHDFIWVLADDVTLTNIHSYGFELSDIIPTRYNFNENVKCWNFHIHRNMLYIWFKDFSDPTIINYFDVDKFIEIGWMS